MTDLVLSPRDGMFLKDGREWASNDGGRAHSLGWPAPSTLHGALTTASGRSAEAVRGWPFEAAEWRQLADQVTIDALLALRRPLVAAPPWAEAHRVWPVPADALFLNDMAGKPLCVQRLDPRPSDHPALGRNEDTAREALWWPRTDDAAKPARAPLWWDEAAFITWLADPAPERACEGCYLGLTLPRHVQAHVGIDPATLAARESILFAHDVVEMLDETHQEWAIFCRAALAGAEPRQATLGGDRRLAVITTAPSDLGACPARLLAAFAATQPKGVRLVAVTPAAFEGGWLPNGFTVASDDTYHGRIAGIAAGLTLHAAFVPRAAHVSGWDMAKGEPKPTTRLVPPGAVYHLVKDTRAPFSEGDAKALWLVALGERTAQGFGHFVPGVWPCKES